MHRTKHLFLIGYLFVCACSGQQIDRTVRATADEAAPERPLDTSQVAEYIVSAFEDSKGNLWFGTNGQGVARWDGEQLRYFTTADGLIDDVVTGIAEDRTGRLWFGTQAGASRYDPAAAQQAGRLSFTGYGPSEGLPGAGCKVLVDRSGSVWAGTSGGVFRFVEGRFAPLELPAPTFDSLSWKITPGKVWDLFEDSKGNIWFGLDGQGALRYDGTTFTRFTKEEGLCSNNVASIQEDAQGNIWFGSITSDHPKYIEEGGVSMYDGVSFTRYPDVRGLTANDIYNIYADRSGNIWIGAVRVGAYRWDGKSFTLFDKTDRPDLTRYFAIQAFVEDRRGRLWFGFSGGLFRFDPSASLRTGGKGFVHVMRGGPWE
ncbi:MAG TPA: two-component regulator propeller domain-containing protein [Flavobacteriales bacterium]